MEVINRTVRISSVCIINKLPESWLTIPFNLYHFQPQKHSRLTSQNSTEKTPPNCHFKSTKQFLQHKLLIQMYIFNRHLPMNPLVHMCTEEQGPCRRGHRRVYPESERHAEGWFDFPWDKKYNEEELFLPDYKSKFTKKITMNLFFHSTLFTSTSLCKVP